MKIVLIFLCFAAAALILAGAAAVTASGHFSPLFVGAALLLELARRAGDRLCKEGETT